MDGFNSLAPKTTYINTQPIKQNIPNLNNLELKVFGTTFNSDTDLTRIERLEQRLMGTIQSGNLRARYNVLEKVIAKYNSDIYSSYYSTPIVSSGGGWRGLAGSLGNFFSTYNGYPTGMTPPIAPVYNTPGYHRGYTSNRGWGYNNVNRGSGTRVHILD